MTLVTEKCLKRRFHHSNFNDYAVPDFGLDIRFQEMCLIEGSYGSLYILQPTFKKYSSRNHSFMSSLFGDFKISSMAINHTTNNHCSPTGKTVSVQ